MILAGMLRDQYYVVNAIACQPPFKKTKPQMRKAALACRAVLLSQLAKFNPQTPVFAMGSYALIGLNGVDMPGGVKNARGFVRKDWSVPRVPEVAARGDEPARQDSGAGEEDEPTGRDTEEDW